MRVLEGGSQAISALRLAIVASCFNGNLVQRLLNNCLYTLRAAGVSGEQLDLVRVPGAFEIPVAMQRLLRAEEPPDVAIALGVVVRGNTRHFDFVSAECSRGLSRLALDTGIPIIFGVLSVENRAQAEERVGPVLATEDIAIGRQGRYSRASPVASLSVNMDLSEYLARHSGEATPAGDTDGQTANRGREYALAALRMASLFRAARDDCG